MIDKVVGGFEGNIWENEKESETLQRFLWSLGLRVYDDHYMKANKQAFKGLNSLHPFQVNGTIMLIAIF